LSLSTALPAFERDVGGRDKGTKKRRLLKTVSILFLPAG
jgi:hypothetical protein